MSTDTESLEELFVSVTGDETVTETQEESPSRDPVDREQAELEETVTSLVREDGLGDAVAGAETGGAGTATGEG